MQCMHDDRRLRRRRARRGFNIVEMLIALSISATLLTATMVALRASYTAYQRTTEVASTHIVARLVMNRVLTLIRTGQDFGPFPVDPKVSVILSDEIEFRDPNGTEITVQYADDPQDGPVLNLIVDGTTHRLLDGVVPQFEGVDRVKPFRLEWELGRRLNRATIDLTVVPDDNQNVEIEGTSTEEIRIVGSAMPRLEAYNN
ncbi:MAG: prepilin-type N-terminal cleavage/methylation domain-containing protein [Planctomycetota bacterium]